MENKSENFESLMRPVSPFHIPNFDPELLKPAVQRIAEESYASEFHKYISQEIVEFDRELDNEHEVGVRLVSFGQSVVFHVRDLGYQNPSLVFFYGITDDGNEVQLIQHVSQISLLLIALKRPDPDKPKRPIGFTGQD